MVKLLGKGRAYLWNWGNGIGEGKIVETFTGKVKRTIKGHEITRNATA